MESVMTKRLKRQAVPSEMLSKEFLRKGDIFGSNIPNICITIIDSFHNVTPYSLVGK